SNLTIEVLHQTIMKLVELQAEGVPLPRLLHLQMDNCSRENKNRQENQDAVNCWALLSLLKVFDVIELHFGLIGHTHD
ncbi:unnamed protein product, partial [Scytosiphon promiscuus]